jgi:hypothetical protein
VKLIKQRKLERYRSRSIADHGHPLTECGPEDALCWIYANLLSTDRGTKAMRASDRNEKIGAKRSGDRFRDYSTSRMRRMYAHKSRPNR